MRPYLSQTGFPTESGLARGAFSVSDTGTVVHGELDTSSTRLTWFDRTGKPVSTLDGASDSAQPALSPDGKVVAVARTDPATLAQDIWLIDTARNIPSRLTSHPNNLTFMPVWSPDGSRVAFASARDAPPNLYQKPTGVGGEELLVKSKSNNQPTDWSPDGRFIVFAGLNEMTQWDLWLLPVSEREKERKPIPFIQTEFNEHLGRVSPNGRWIVYASDESGRNDVYVQAFPAGGAKIRISANGGNEPKWRGDGKELFYLAPDGRMMAAAVKSEANFEIRSLAPLFKVRIESTHNHGYDLNYAPARDGKAFLINALSEQSKSSPMTTVLLNWRAALTDAASDSRSAIAR